MDGYLEKAEYKDQLRSDQRRASELCTKVNQSPKGKICIKRNDRVKRKITLSGNKAKGEEKQH